MRGWDWHRHHHEEMRAHFEQRFGPRAYKRHRRARRLQSRLFMWFLGAIVMALFASGATMWATHASDSPFAAGRVATQTIGQHLARRWDDPGACDAYLDKVRETVGLDFHVQRDPKSLPHGMLHNGGIGFDHQGHAYIPVVRDGVLLGAVEFETGAGPQRWWNVVAALSAALFALAFAARGVARRLAWPLEAVAKAAERFGSGDLTSRTNIDQGRRRHWVAEEVRDVARAFDTMAERIEGVVRDQRELLGAISHELRSPLGRARVALEIARERSGEASMPSFDQIDHQLSDVDAILGDLLAAARAGLSDLRPQTTALLPWLRARIASEPNPPAIELDAPDAVIDIELEPALMNRALHNLFANARAHGHPEDQPMEVNVLRDGARVTIVVRDRGPGFAPDLLAKAFDPFVKGDVARTPGSGSGLGLALVRRIVEAHHGTAFARNVVVDGVVTGAEVGMELPLGAPVSRKSPGRDGARESTRPEPSSPSKRAPA